MPFSVQTIIQSNLPLGYTGSQGDTGFTGSQGPSGAGFTGSVGFTGSAGSVGFTGSQGFRGGAAYVFSSTTTDADPGNGIIRYNNATIASVTFIFIDNLDALGITQTAWYDTWDDANNGTRGFLTIENTLSTGTTLNIFRVTGNVTVAAGYYKIPVAFVTGSMPVNTAGITVSFSRSGDVGFTGSQGTTGFTGSQGTTGFTGSQGIQGGTGFTGSQGPQGNTGFTGSQGTQGGTGFTGSQGSIGFTGSAGFTGSQGAIGFTGSAGPSTTINAANDVATTALYPVFVGAAGSNQTAKATPTKLSFNANTGELSSTIFSGAGTNLTGTAAGLNIGGNAGSATNVAGGAANRIPVQTGAGATTFIIAPTVGSTFLQWTGSGFAWAAASGSSGASVSTGISPPSSPNNGDLWWNSQNGILHVFYADGDSSQWVSVAVGTPDVSGGGGTLATDSATLSADVQLPVTGTWYDGPTLSLAAGTWYVSGTVTFNRTATTATQWLARISDGTNHYASSQTYQGSVSGHTDSLSLTAIITLASTTTIRLQGTTTAGATACLMKASTPASSSGNNATIINAMKVG
jgi:hypothetical protein